MDVASVLGYKIKLPKYDETTLFFVNLVLVILFATDAAMRAQLLGFFINPGQFAAALAGFLCTIYFSLFNVKNRVGKELMGLYIILINFFIANTVLADLIKSGQYDYRIIIPAINFLVCIGTFAAMRLAYISAGEFISDRHAKKQELLVGIILIPLLFFASAVLMKNSWAETFSLCLFYVTFVNNFLAKTLFRQNAASAGGSDAREENKSFRLLAKRVLLLVFIIGMYLQIGYVNALEMNRREAERIKDEAYRNIIYETEEKEESYKVGGGVPYYVTLENDPTTYYDHAGKSKEGDSVKIKGVIKGYPTKKAETNFPGRIQRVNTPRVVLYNLKGDNNYYTARGYYAFCDARYSSELGEVVEFEGVIGSYSVFNDGSGPKEKCIAPRSGIRTTDKNDLIKTALKSYRSRVDFLKRFSLKSYKDDQAVLGNFGDSIDDYDGMSLYWIEDKKEYAVVLNYDLGEERKLYFSFEISESDNMTQELRIFPSDKIR